jgi:hypothetical protein
VPLDTTNGVPNPVTVYVASMLMTPASAVIVHASVSQFAGPVVVRAGGETVTTAVAVMEKEPIVKVTGVVV